MPKRSSIEKSECAKMCRSGPAKFQSVKSRAALLSKQGLRRQCTLYTVKFAPTHGEKKGETERNPCGARARRVVLREFLHGVVHLFQGRVVCAADAVGGKSVRDLPPYASPGLSSTSQLRLAHDSIIPSPRSSLLVGPIIHRPSYARTVLEARRGILVVPALQELTQRLPQLLLEDGARDDEALEDG